MKLSRFAPLLLIAAPLLAGCPKAAEEDTRPPALPALPPGTGGAFAKLDPWILETDKIDANRGNHGVFLGNGRIGITLGAFGPDRDSRCYVAGVYDPHENLLAIPLFKPNPPAPPTEGAYKQTLDLKRGVLTTKLGDSELTVFVSRATPGLVVFHAKGTAAIAALDGLVDGGDARILLPQVSVYGVRKTEGESVSLYLAARPEPSNAYEKLGAEPMAKRAADSGYEKLLADHVSAWAKLWEADIVIEGDPEAQQLVHKAMFDLLQSGSPNSADSIPPESLSGDFYKGHIFWDAEVWMFPALLAQHPEYAKSLLNYRVARLAAAQAQAKSKGFAGADFPWESAASGKETAPGGFSEGRHVTAAVGWAAWQYGLATGDAAWLKGDGGTLIRQTASYFASRAKKTATGYSIGPVTGPDELNMGVTDNAYTNAMAKRVLEAAAATVRPADPKWAAVAKGLIVPFDSAKGVFLKNVGDDGKQTKQADGELLLWPARQPMDSKIAAATFDFHKTRPIRNGPAMTDSIHALIAARLGRAPEADEDFRDSYRPFVRGPFVLFSEKRSMSRCVFTTGLGGVLQSVLYGFGGVDFEDWASVSKRPVALPPSWKALTLTGVRYRGRAYTIKVTASGRTVHP